MKSEAYKEKVNTGDEMVARIINNATIIMQEQDDLRALHVLLHIDYRRAEGFTVDKASFYKNVGHRTLAKLKLN